MIFEADFTQTHIASNIVYVPLDYSFEYKWAGVTDSSLLIDYLELDICSWNRIVYGISGFHSYMIWEKRS